MVFRYIINAYINTLFIKIISHKNISKIKTSIALLNWYFLIEKV